MPLAPLVVSLYVAQLAVGLLNLRLLTPIAPRLTLQLLHLLLADLLWIALVLLANTASGVPSCSQRGVSDVPARRGL